MCKYFVFRINYADNFSIIRKEIIGGNLRQGWGAIGMNIGTLSSQESFCEAWRNRWGADDETQSKMKSKYKNLNIMLEIEKGDKIVIPKLSLDDGIDYPTRAFTVVECTEPYRFSVLKGKNDFGHIIGVKTLFSCPYQWKELASYTIAAKFKAYQNPLNRVYNSAFIESVEKLTDINTKEPIGSKDEKKDYTFILAQELNERYNELVYENLLNLQKLPPKDFEDLIEELFKKNGFITKAKNKYDGKGGDIDIQMMLDEKTLLGAIFKQSKEADNMFINIQAKKKAGHDWDAGAAVDQLIKKRETSNINHYIDIVIDLTDEFDEETERKAIENNVILVNGKQFSLLLLQYGLVGEVDI